MACISFPYDALKSELYTITQRAGNTTKYTVDEMAKTAGCEVVRLPVANCTLNPIELAWAQVKGHITSNARALLRLSIGLMLLLLSAGLIWFDMYRRKLRRKQIVSRSNTVSESSPSVSVKIPIILMRQTPVTQRHHLTRRTTCCSVCWKIVQYSYV